MRLAFLGTPDFAVPSLDALCRAGHEVALVVTQPDARKGRGLHTTPPAVKAAALRLGLSVYQPAGINTSKAVERLTQAAPELGIVVAYGQILRPAVLDVPMHGYLNLHASLLPAYRGAAPVNWAVIRGEKTTGVTVQRVVLQMDAGPVLAHGTAQIGPEETAGELHERLSRIGAELLAGVVGRLAVGNPPPELEQDHARATFAPKLAKDDGLIDWSLPARSVHNLVRGLTPWPGAAACLVTGVRREEIIVLRARVETAPAGAFEDALPGTVVAADDGRGIVVKAGRGLVAVLELKPAAGRAMSASDFLHGRSVRPGDRFT
jgi:methionyl-tRNA formyltransferase